MMKIFDVDTTNIKDEYKAVQLFNEIIKGQIELGIAIQNIENHLKAKKPEIYNGKDFLLKDYMQNIEKIDREFKIFAELRGRRAQTYYPLSREQSMAELKFIVSKLLLDNPNDPKKVIDIILKRYHDKSVQNLKILESLCPNQLFKEFERAYVNNQEIIRQHIRQNITTKTSSQPR